ELERVALARGRHHNPPRRPTESPRLARIATLLHVVRVSGSADEPLDAIERAPIAHDDDGPATTAAARAGIVRAGSCERAGTVRRRPGSPPPGTTTRLEGDQPVRRRARAPSPPRVPRSTTRRPTAVRRMTP